MSVNNEFEEAKKLAEIVLNRPFTDHDDTIAVLARQFNRSVEREIVATQTAYEGWKEATIAWTVCASVHRSFGLNQHALSIAYQDDYDRHEKDARQVLLALQKGEKTDLQTVLDRLTPTIESIASRGLIAVVEDILKHADRDIRMQAYNVSYSSMDALTIAVKNEKEANQIALQAPAKYSIDDERFEDLRSEIARVIEIAAKDGLDDPRALDVALDAIFCSIVETLNKA